MRIRIKCLNDTWKEGLKDPDLTKGKFYNLLDKDVPVMNGESLLSFIGDNRVEVQRPKYLFKNYQG